MYRSILIPLDGTPFGEQALPVGVEVAKRSGATLHLVHVHSPGSSWTPLEGMMPGAAGAGPITQVEDRAYLEGVLAALRREGPVEGDVGVLEGPVGRSVAESARAARVDLVVMSTHGRTGLSRLWHRDVAGYLTRNLNVPVLAVPVRPGAPAAPSAPELKRVLVPLGGRPQNSEVLENVAQFCAALGAQITVLRVVEPPMEVGYTLLGQDAHVNHFLLEDLDERAKQYLETSAARLRSHDLTVEIEVVHGANPAEAILDFAGSRAVDVIAVGTHGMGTVRHLFSASVVESVVNGSTIPVLVQHEQGSGTEGAYEESISGGMGWKHHPSPAVVPPRTA